MEIESESLTKVLETSLTYECCVLEQRDTAIALEVKSK